MTIANSSAPASQSEHLLAHVLTMKFAQKTQAILHGRLIASSTISSLINQQKIVENFSKNSPIKLLENYFEELQNKNISTKIKNYFFGLQTLKFFYRHKLDFLQHHFGKIDFWTFINVHFSKFKKTFPTKI